MADDVGDDLLRRIEDGTCWITLNRPDAGIAMATPMRDQIGDWMIEASADPWVRVGVRSPREARETFNAFMDEAPDADGVIVAELVPAGTETVVGVAQDELFGPVVMFGLGGVFVEVLGDVTFRVPPFGKDEARRMLDELKGAALLRGARGRPKADINAIVDVIMKVQRLAMDLSDDLAELDINPLVALSKGAVALDALVVKA